VSDLQSLETEELHPKDLDDMMESAKEATDFLKALAHEGRLIILCRLADKECSVAELEEMLSARQAAVSQQLARLRLEGLVSTRREGKTIYYSLSDHRVRRSIKLIYELFC
jgi:DNA-binding transcriptional ArsR family regulator